MTGTCWQGSVKRLCMSRPKDSHCNIFELLRRRAPNWPEAWFDLAEAKARQRQLDAEFDQALLQALQLGPWEMQLQKRVADLSLLLYEWLSPKAQQVVKDNWLRMAQSQPHVLLALAHEYQALGRICSYFLNPKPMRLRELGLRRKRSEKPG